MNDHHASVPLSVEAQTRADALLPALRDELARAVRRRNARTRAAGSVIVLAFLVGAIAVRIRPAPPLPIPRAEAPSSASAVPMPLIEVVRSLDTSSIEIIRDTPRDAVLALYAAPGVDFASILITDRELLDLLNDIGRPSGLVRANGKVWLTATVTDEELAKPRGM